MRVIKFRAWDVKTNAYYFTDGFGDEPYYLDRNGKPCEGIVTAGVIGAHPERFVLMQFTGLEDKNGKEIYEGDIVRCSYYSNVNPRDYDDDNYFDTRPRIGQIK